MSTTPSTSEEITALLRAGREGDRASFDRLVPLVYEPLRRIAHGQLSLERDDHTLGTTGLVHEAYVKLVDQRDADFKDRSHFYRIAARCMRRVLIDHARRHGAAKRGGGRSRVDLEAAGLSIPARADRLLALDEALDRLSGLNERLVRVVECRFFAALTEEETADALGVTARTVRRDWVKARGWLYTALDGTPG